VPRRQLALASLLPIGALAAVPAPRLTHLLTAPLPPVAAQAAMQLEPNELGGVLRTERLRVQLQELAAHVRTRLGKKQKRAI